MTDASPRLLVAGIGCASTATADEIVALVTATLASAGRAPAGLACIATIDSRAAIAALHSAARHFGVPLQCFAAAELATENHRLATPPSGAHSGIPAVAEAAALKAGSLLVAKQKSAHATCAIGLATAPFDVAGFGRGAEA
jgi:cobalt-precorrin 5A hydrolase/precorrin-3B C17-methyltransferase